MIDVLRGWRLSFRDLLLSAGIDPAAVLLIRHTFGESGLPTGATAEEVLAFTREQKTSRSKIQSVPPRYWFIFAADGGTTARLINVYVNDGEIMSERTADSRYFALSPSDVMAELRGRLVVEWGADAINWAKHVSDHRRFPVVEIADRASIPFPRYDKVLLTYADLCELVDDPRYTEWRTALREIQGIYLITDSSDGRHYVGKANGGENILGRWAQYAHDGHGGNVELRALIQHDPAHRQHFRYSLLQVFGPHTPDSLVLAAESHFKRALMSVEFGLNKN